MTANPTCRVPRERRDERRLALLDAMIDVLEHDDRVVDDEADRQHQREQGQQVDRIAERATARRRCRAGRSAR